MRAFSSKDADYFDEKRMTDAYGLKLNHNYEKNFLNKALWNKKSKYFRFEVYDVAAEVIGYELIIIAVPMSGQYSHETLYQTLIVRVDYTQS